jgi:hypothetical protein
LEKPGQSPGFCLKSKAAISKFDILKSPPIVTFIPVFFKAAAAVPASLPAAG